MATTRERTTGVWEVRVFTFACSRGPTLGQADADVAHRARRVAELVIGSRQDDHDDARTITRARSPERRLVVEHRPPRREQMPWIADAATWAIGSGPNWSDRLGRVLSAVVETRPGMR